jgi:hypothetical protein
MKKSFDEVTSAFDSDAHLVPNTLRRPAGPEECGATVWSLVQDSNLRQPVSKTGALIQLSYSPGN